MPKKTKEQNLLEKEGIQEKNNPKPVENSSKIPSKKSSTSTRTSIQMKKETKSTTKTKSAKTTQGTTSKKTTTQRAKKQAQTDTKKKTSLAKSTTKRNASTTTKAKTKTTSHTNIKSTKKTLFTHPSHLKTNFKRRKSVNKMVSIVEYYDLPYRYNQTIVKVLAQTPTNLFVYWDISDTDRKHYKEQYGENFFEITKPVLIVYNDTYHYSFEIDINDFANSWYLSIKDAKCQYRVELGRRPITYNEKIKTDYIYVTMSNEIEAPNDKILLDHEQKMVYFRNVKTGTQTAKSIATFSFLQNMGKFYSVREWYKKIYPNENIEEIENFRLLSNPSSGNPSSESLSSRFQ